MIRKLAISLSGLGMCVLLLGCGANAVDTAGGQGGATASTHDHADSHDHGAPGPHGGHVIVLGDEEYHAELTHDETSHTVAIYLLDGAIQDPVSNGPVEVVLQVFRDGEFVDHVLKSSAEEGMYAVADEALCGFLLHTPEVKGRIRVEIGGTQYVGILEHEAHAHAGHDGHDHGTGESGHGHDHDGDETGHDLGGADPESPRAAGHDHGGHDHEH